MRRVTVQPDAVVVVDVPRPGPEAHEVLVESRVMGVCGTDTHAAAGLHPFVRPPYHPGHEVVGLVRARGAAVADVEVGDRVIVEPTLPCWSCKPCRGGRPNLCENLRFFGCGHDQGGMADYFTIPADRVHRLPDDLDDLQALLIEPLAAPVHAVALTAGVAGKAVVVIGAGTIGLLVLAAARYAGARRVVVTDMLADKRERARRLGADAVVDAAAPEFVALVRAELGESADVVFDCVAAQSTMDQSVALALRGGVVMVVGVPARPVILPLSLIQDAQIRVQGSATYVAEDYATATAIIRSGLVRVEDFVTARFPLERAAEAFAASAAGHEVKVVLTR